MKRWIPAVCLTTITAVFIGCSGVTGLDNDPAFRPMIGKVLRTKKDLVVMDFKGSKKALALHIPGTSGVPELKDIPTQLPSNYYGHMVYGVFPTGGMLTVAHVEKVTSVEFSFIDVYATVTSEGKFRGQRLDIGILTNQKTGVPTFDAEFLDEIPVPSGK